MVHGILAGSLNHAFFKITISPSNHSHKTLPHIPPQLRLNHTQTLITPSLTKPLAQMTRKTRKLFKIQPTIITFVPVLHTMPTLMRQPPRPHTVDIQTSIKRGTI